MSIHFPIWVRLYLDRETTIEIEIMVICMRVGADCHPYVLLHYGGAFLANGAICFEMELILREDTHAA